MIAEIDTKLNQRQYGMLRRCSKKKDIKVWNEWRKAHPRTAVHLVGADLDNAALERADLERADLRAANLQSAVLAGANLREANLNGAMLFGADLRNADFHGAYLYGADLSGANLEGANLIEANLSKTDFKGAKLSGLRLDSNAPLNELAHPLSEKQMASVILIATPTQEDATQENETQESETQENEVATIGEEHSREVPVEAKNKAAIVRSITFDRENILAGIGILSYFGEILRQKYENNKAKVILEQEGLKVRLAIETADGEKRGIEKALENYITVVTGRETIANYLPEPLAGLAFKQKLDLVHMELKQAEALHTSNKAQGGNSIPPSEDSLDRLHHLLSENICISRD